MPASKSPTAHSFFESKRVVVKIGSALLVDPGHGRLNQSWLESVVDDVLRLRRRGCEVLLVSSGAIALGRRYLGLADGSLRLEESQAAAAAGQIRLAHAFQAALDKYDVHVAQILVTLGDTEQRQRYLNARSTLNTLLRMGAVPVANENDTVATAEIRYGDNDRLAARVAQMISADCLVLLSDVDGLYSGDPHRNSHTTHIGTVEAITPEIEAAAGESHSDYGSGGMVTKIAAAKIAVSAGCYVVLAGGRQHHPIRAVEEGAQCTWFMPRGTPLSARKQWIAGSLKALGTFVVDSGAETALAAGKSLLPAGVVDVQGEFQRGDAVAVTNREGRRIAQGLSGYSSNEAQRIMGHRSSEIESILRYRGRDELIHRDDLVVI